MPKPTPAREQEKTLESEQRERARGGAGGSAVETVPCQPRRTFSAAEKLRIVKRADACLASGAAGRAGGDVARGGHLQFAALELADTARSQGARSSRGAQARPQTQLDAKDKRNAELLKRNAHLEPTATSSATSTRSSFSDLQNAGNAATRLRLASARLLSGDRAERPHPRVLHPSWAHGSSGGAYR